MDLVLRAAVIYVVILAVTRFVGRRELNSMEPFDIIMLVVIGDLVQQGITQSDYSVTGAVTVISTIALLTIAFGYLPFRFPRLRPVLEGEPIVLVQDGRILERNLRRERMTRDELLAEARIQQIPSIDRVRFAVLETSGQISFIPADGGGGGGGRQESPVS
jgi:uncharacterized membrane protein YcaP (DUF421 family)